MARQGTAMNYSLRTLLIVATGIAFLLACLVYPMPILGDLFYTLGLLAIAFAVIAVTYIRGSQRAFWVGFLILFAGYFCHTVWPSEIRSTWSYLQRSGNIGYASQGVVTSRMLAFAFESLHPSALGGQPYNRRYPGFAGPMSPEQTAGQFISFITIGHTTIGVLLGVVGGVAAQRIAIRTLPLVKRPLESVLREMEKQ